VYQSLDELEGKRFAYITGSVYNQFVRRRVSDTSESFYASLADCIAALEAGKVDAAVQLSSGCQLAVNRKGGTVAMLPERIVDVHPSVKNRPRPW
jgi:ABC-type amino acid transport substrate-binding protein